MNCNTVGCPVELCEGSAAYCHHCHQREVEEAYQNGRRAGIEIARYAIVDSCGCEDGEVDSGAPDPQGNFIMIDCPDCTPMDDAIRRAISDGDVAECDCTNRAEACAECGKNERVDGEFFCAKCLDDFDSRDFDRMETPRDYGYDGSGW